MPTQEQSGPPRWWQSRAPERPPLRAVLIQGTTLLVCLGIVTGLGELTGYLLLLPPLAATGAIVLGAPDTPLAQPRNVILGQAVAATVGVALGLLLSPSVWSAALAAAVGFGAMLLLRAAHTPGVATAMLGTLTGTVAPLTFIASVAVAGSLLVAAGWVAHRLLGDRYPVYWW